MVADCHARLVCNEKSMHLRVHIGNRTWAYSGLPFGQPLWFVAALVNNLMPRRTWLLSGALEIPRLRLWLRLHIPSALVTVAQGRLLYGCVSAFWILNKYRCIVLSTVCNIVYVNTHIHVQCITDPLQWLTDIHASYNASLTTECIADRM